MKHQSAMVIRPTVALHRIRLIANRHAPLLPRLIAIQTLAILKENLPFGEAEAGATGLELLLSLALNGQQHRLSLLDTLAAITSKPSQVLASSLGTLASSVGRLSVGGAADVCIFDPATEWSVSAQQLRSQGKHTPFAHEMSGSMMTARVTHTVVNGQLAFEKL